MPHSTGVQATEEEPNKWAYTRLNFQLSILEVRVKMELVFS